MIIMMMSFILTPLLIYSYWYGAPFWCLTLIALVAIIPISDSCISLSNLIVARFIKPRVLPRVDLEKSISNTENVDPTANKGFTANLPGLDNILRTAVLGANTVGLFNKAENEQLITPDYSQSDSRMNALNANLDAARDSALSERNAASGAIRGGASSYQSMLARELQNSANLNQANLNISLQEQQLQNQINQQVGSYEANKAVDTANRQYQNRVDNLMNEANNRNIKRAILGDTLAEADRISTIKNNEQILTATVAETQALLNSIYPDMGVNDEWIMKAKQLAKGEITEEAYQTFVTNKKNSAIKIKE
jgi:hypothetical protein